MKVMSLHSQQEIEVFLRRSPFLHLYALNRGVLLTPFHNMALMCPATTAVDIDLHTTIFASAISELTS